jgi:hypothetical protein
VPALDLAEGPSMASPPREWAELGIAGIGMSPTKPEMGEMKLSKSYIRTIKTWDLEEVIFEQREIWRNPHEGFTQVDKNSNLENGVRVQMDEFNLVVIKESTEKIASREAKSVLEVGREHHNLSRIGCRNVFHGSRAPLQDGAVWEKVIRNKLADFTFIHDGRLEKMWVCGSHCEGERS